MHPLHLIGMGRSWAVENLRPTADPTWRHRIAYVCYGGCPAPPSVGSCLGEMPEGCRIARHPALHIQGPRFRNQARGLERTSAPSASGLCWNVTQALPTTMLHHPERVHASSECVRQSFNLLELEHCPQSGTRLTATVAATLLSCLSYRAEICHGEQRAARQQREAQAEEGEAEVRPARVVFFYSIQGRRKETRIADAILRVPTLCAGFDGYVVFWADAALLRLPTSARRGRSAAIEWVGYPSGASVCTSGLKVLPTTCGAG